jgi:hypothetical protein
MLTDGLVAYLNAQVLIPSIVGDRIQPIPAPDDMAQYPLITYMGASYKDEYANEGSVGVSTQRIVFDCLALRYHDARTLALALKDAFEALCEAVNAGIGAAYVLPDGTRVFNAETGNLIDRWQDGSRVSCTSVHLLIQSNE